MSQTTLTYTQPGILDASGNCVITLRPDSGQNWAPLFVRVSTGSKASPVAYCAVYHGSPGVPPQQSQFIDDTFLGSGDSSSMIAGTPVLFGEALLFSFSGGTPGDTAIATVYGMQSDLPPNLGLVPQVPGTHFAGHPTTEIVTTLASVSQLSPVTVAPGTQLTLGPFDVRQYESYYFKAFATSLNVATAFNPFAVDVFWTEQTTSPQGILFQDGIATWSSAASGAFSVALGPIEMQDNHHGPYFNLTMTNNAASDPITVFYTLKTTTRLIPQPAYKDQHALDGIFANVTNTPIGAGATLDFVCPYTHGRAFQKLQVTGANAVTFTVVAAGISTAIEQYLAMPAGTIDRREIILPKRAIMYQVTAAAASSFVIYGVSQYDRVS